MNEGYVKVMLIKDIRRYMLITRYVMLMLIRIETSLEIQKLTLRKYIYLRSFGNFTFKIGSVLRSYNKFTVFYTLSTDQHKQVQNVTKLMALY